MLCTQFTNKICKYIIISLTIYASEFSKEVQKKCPKGRKRLIKLAQTEGRASYPIMTGNDKMICPFCPIPKGILGSNHVDIVPQKQLQWVHVMRIGYIHPSHQLINTVRQIKHVSLPWISDNKLFILYTHLTIFF